MPDRKGKVFLNKLGAAERQLSAAIRLYFLEEDRIAVHTIANAAYGIFSDLLKKRGKPEHVWPIHYGLLRAAYDYAHGSLRLSEIESKFREASDVIVELSKEFQDDPNLSPDECHISGADPGLLRDWQELRAPANFLKHADRDAASLLDEADLETEEVILRAINASLHLNAPFSSEKEFFWSALYALRMLSDPPQDNPTILALTAYEPEEVMELGRRNLCRKIFERVVLIDQDRAQTRLEQALALKPPPNL